MSSLSGSEAEKGFRAEKLFPDFLSLSPVKIPFNFLPPGGTLSCLLHRINLLQQSPRNHAECPKQIHLLPTLFHWKKTRQQRSAAVGEHHRNAGCVANNVGTRKGSMRNVSAWKTCHFSTTYELKFSLAGMLEILFFQINSRTYVSESHSLSPVDPASCLVEFS